MKKFTFTFNKLFNVKGLVIALALMGLSPAASAQVYSIVGNGTTYNDTWEYPAPYGNYYWFSRHQLYISPAEMTAAGVPPGANIQGLAFNVYSMNGQSYVTQWAVAVFTTTSADPLASGMVSTGQVSNGGAPLATYTAQTGWNSHSLTPFMWNGTDGVIVETCHAHNTQWSDNASTYWTTNLTGSEIKSRWLYQDNVTACQTSGFSGTSTTTRPNLRFEWLGSPCATTPATTNISPATYSTCPGLGNPTLNISASYTNSGIVYQWQSSTISPVGPFTPVPGATLNTAPIPTLGVTTWYQLTIGCVNAGTVTTPSSQIFVAGPTTDGVPYYEGFENIQGPDRLPNCSWWANNLGSTVKTYTASSTNNRLPRTGNNFMAYSLPSSNNLVYTNGIQMEPGITYSAALHYATEYFGYDNWTELSILIGTSQSSTGLVPVASVAPAISGPYKLLSGLFTVPSSGIYYMAIKASSKNGSALYLNIDDISITIPCTPGSPNNPTVTLSASNVQICQGDVVNLSAVGADDFMWSTNSNSASISAQPIVTTTYTVTGTNTLTGCTDVKTQQIEVLETPTVFVVASADAVCAGNPVYLSAFGADSYLWNGGPSQSVYMVNPTASGAYTVQGTKNSTGCSASASASITVHPNPTVTAFSDRPDMCLYEVVTLTGTGGVFYEWFSSSDPSVYNGASINVSPNTPTNYTLIVTDANGCQNSVTLLQNVEVCGGIDKNSVTASGIKVYPNPASSLLFFESNKAISSIELVDVSGRVVRSVAGSSERTEIRINDLSNGVYYAKITTGERTEVVRIVKH